MFGNLLTFYFFFRLCTITFLGLLGETQEASLNNLFPIKLRIFMRSPYFLNLAKKLVIKSLSIVRKARIALRSGSGTTGGSTCMGGGTGIG
jgi:hypothetical protein